MISGYVYFFVGLITGIAFCVGIPGLPDALRKMVGQIKNYKQQLEEEKRKQEGVNKQGELENKWKDLNIEFCK